jgi:hypothetical protein
MVSEASQPGRFRRAVGVSRLAITSQDEASRLTPAARQLTDYTAGRQCSHQTPSQSSGIGHHAPSSPVMP